MPDHHLGKAAEPAAGAAADRAAERFDAAPAFATLRLGARAIRVPRWWAEAEGYRDGDPLRPADIERAEVVSAAARGALAALDRLTARAPAAETPPAPLRPGTGRLVLVALLASAATLAAAHLLARLFG